jgi:hypothetical protein
MIYTLIVFVILLTFTIEPKYLGKLKLLSLQNITSKTNVQTIRHGLLIAFLLWLVYYLFHKEITTFFRKEKEPMTEVNESVKYGDTVNLNLINGESKEPIPLLKILNADDINSREVITVQKRVILAYAEDENKRLGMNNDRFLVTEDVTAPNEEIHYNTFWIKPQVERIDEGYYTVKNGDKIAIAGGGSKNMTSNCGWFGCRVLQPKTGYFAHGGKKDENVPYVQVLIEKQTELTMTEPTKPATTEPTMTESTKPATTEPTMTESTKPATTEPTMTESTKPDTLKPTKTETKQIATNEINNPPLSSLGTFGSGTVSVSQEDELLKTQAASGPNYETSHGSMINHPELTKGLTTDKVTPKPVYYEPGTVKYNGLGYVPSYSEMIYLNNYPFESKPKELHNGNPHGFCSTKDNVLNNIEEKCNGLPTNVCSTTDCCVLVGGTHCVEGDEKGPKNKVIYSDTTIKNRDVYYYKGNCYGNCK